MAGIANVSRPATHGLVRIAVPAVVIVAVVAFGLAIVRLPGWTTADLGILHALDAARTPFMSGVPLTINWLFSPPVAAGITAVIAALIVVLTRRLRSAALFVALVAVPWLGSEVIKFIVRRPRPDASLLSHPLLAPEHSFSFPSGHTAFATALCLALILTIMGRRWRPLCVVLAILVTALTGYSRMYLGVHYLSDVVASIIYAFAAGALVFALWQRFVPIRESPQ